ncbi:MAG: hypothetical protein ACKPCN_08420 [Dolichospermum sp.]
MNEKTVRSSLKVLLGAGMIAVVESKKGRSVVYEVAPHEDWATPEELPNIRNKRTPTKSGTTTPTKSGTTPLPNLADEVFPFKEVPLSEREDPPTPKSEFSPLLQTQRGALEQTHFSDNKSEICNSPITPHEDGYSAPALQNVYTKAKDVYELIDMFLLSPETSDAPPPTEMMSVFREKAKWHGWVLPWRSLKIHHEFQNCNPEIVCSLAADLARKDKATPAQKYGHAIATINQWEKTKGGWVNLMVLCDRPIADEPTLSETSQQLSIPQYIRDWYESQHEYHYRTQYLKSASLEDFFKGKDNQAWYQFAKEKFPSWDWTKINSKNEDKTLCLLKMS